MPRVPLESTLLASVLYDAALQRLDLEFRSGERYLYFTVPPSCYRHLIAAQSKGAYFNQYIRNCFPFQHLSPLPGPIVLPAHQKTK